MAMLCDLGNRTIHLFVVNPTWGRRARHVRLSRCQDGAREILSNRECSCANEEQAFSALIETLRIQQFATAGSGCSPRGFTPKGALIIGIELFTLAPVDGQVPNCPSGYRDHRQG